MHIEYLPPRQNSDLTSKSGGRLLLLSATVAALGSLLFGFDTAVISGTTETLRHVFALSENLLGFTVSTALFGTMFGAFGASYPVDKWGRRPVLICLAVLFIVAAIGCASAWNWYALIFFRFMGGVGVGAASVVCPMYITEIAPAKRRGVLVAISQLNIVVGILLAYFSNYFLGKILGASCPGLWRWMFGMMVIPALFFFTSALFIPESPRWLVKRGKSEEAESILKRFGDEDPKEEVRDIQNSLSQKEGGPWESIWQRKYAKPLLLVLMVAAFNQLDGINAVIYYTSDIFRMAGADQASALTQSVLVGLTNLVMTLVGMVLIDRVGRKALLLCGSVTFVLAHSLAAFVFATHTHGWLVMAAMIGIVGSHAYSQGAVVWVVINEMLPNRVRAQGAAMACFLIWALCAAVSWGFPVVAKASGAIVFGIFATMMLLQFILVAIFLPETKGIGLEQLQARLSKASS